MTHSSSGRWRRVEAVFLVGGVRCCVSSCADVVAILSTSSRLTRSEDASHVRRARGARLRSEGRIPLGPAAGSRETNRGQERQESRGDERSKRLRGSVGSDFSDGARPWLCQGGRHDHVTVAPRRGAGAPSRLLQERAGGRLAETLHSTLQGDRLESVTLSTFARSIASLQPVSPPANLRIRRRNRGDNIENQTADPEARCSRRALIRLWGTSRRGLGESVRPQDQRLSLCFHDRRVRPGRG